MDDIKIVDDQVMFTMKETMFFAITAAKDENLPKAHLIVDKFCKQVAINRYRKGSKEIKDMLMKMKNKEVKNWLNEIWDKFISDNDIVRIFKSTVGVKNYE